MSWDPFEEIKKFQKEMNKTFEKFFNRQLLPMKKDFALEPMHEPLSDVEVKGKNVIVKVDLPGVEKEDITLNVTDDYVEVKAEKKMESRIEKKGLFKQKRSYKGFYRVIPLPCKVKADNVKAEYKNGVLKIITEKSKASSKKKRIKVR